VARKEIAAEVFLAGVPLFRELDAATLRRLAAGTARRSLERGETLFRRGDPATGMYVVVFGEIRLVSNTRVRGERLTGIVGPGQSFGEPVMFLERPVLVDARAAADSLLLHLPKETVFAEIERSPRFARRMIAALSKRIETLVGELDRQAIRGGTERFADYLLHRARGGPAPAVVTLASTKAAVATQLNLSPEHFSRILHELAESGLLSVDGRRITIPDLNRLEAAARRR
jgi:CRP/FNR family transcriptional regulator, dissimilatory nitrate respiration regulator